MDDPCVVPYSIFVHLYTPGKQKLDTIFRLFWQSKKTFWKKWLYHLIALGILYHPVYFCFSLPLKSFHWFGNQMSRLFAQKRLKLTISVVLLSLKMITFKSLQHTYRWCLESWTLCSLMMCFAVVVNIQ